MARLRLRAPFPALSLPDLAGGMRSLSGDWAQGTALFIVAHGECPTSRLTLPFVDRLHQRRGAGRSVVAILQEEPESARSLAADLGLSLPIVLDREPYSAGEQLGLETVPTLVLVDGSGLVQTVSEGFSRDELESTAGLLGVALPLFNAADEAPRLRPG
jgi:hypothetical protein